MTKQWQSMLGQLVAGPPAPPARRTTRRSYKVARKLVKCRACGKSKGAMAFVKQEDNTLSNICRKCTFLARHKK